jgi:hypothetical protein
MNLLWGVQTLPVIGYTVRIPILTEYKNAYQSPPESS